MIKLIHEGGDDIKRLTFHKYNDYTPHTEYYFDEITEQLLIRCPATRRLITVEAIRRAYETFTLL